MIVRFPRRAHVGRGVEALGPTIGFMVFLRLHGPNPPIPKPAPPRLVLLPSKTAKFRIPRFPMSLHVGISASFFAPQPKGRRTCRAPKPRPADEGSAFAVDFLKTHPNNNQTPVIFQLPERSRLTRMPKWIKSPGRKSFPSTLTCRSQIVKFCGPAMLGPTKAALPAMFKLLKLGSGRRDNHPRRPSPWAAQFSMGFSSELLFFLSILPLERRVQTGLSPGITEFDKTNQWGVGPSDGMSTLVDELRYASHNRPVVVR